MIALHSTVHDQRVALFPNALLGNIVIRPVRETPHGAVNLAEFSVSAGIVSDRVLEFLVEIRVVQEDIGIIVPAVEMPLDRLDRLNHALDFLIPSQDNKRSVCSGRAIVDMKAARSKHLVLPFAYFSVEACQYQKNKNKYIYIYIYDRLLTLLTAEFRQETTDPQTVKNVEEKGGG